MAKNKMTKWIVGAASVFAFTGFIGSINQLDETNPDTAGTVNDPWNHTTASVEQDLVRNEWMNSYFYEEDDDDYDDFHHYFNNEYEQPSQQTNYRTRAS